MTAVKKLASSVLPSTLISPYRLSKDTFLRLQFTTVVTQRMAAIVLQRQFPQIRQQSSGRLPLSEHEFTICSQNGEDGVLLYLFSQIGVTNRKFVEIGIGDGRECNTANLAISFGWTGTMIDCDEEKIRHARAYYRALLGVSTPSVNLVCAAVTAENIDSVLLASRAHGGIDLLSIDIDGNDFWLWKAITVISPRVIVIEYNASLGVDPVTVPYDPHFNYLRAHRSGMYHGASLSALVKLATCKGYSLVHCESRGINAFFVRDDAMSNTIRALAHDEAYRPHYYRSLEEDAASQYSRIAGLPLVNV